MSQTSQTSSVVDSVMGHMKALLQELTDAADLSEAQWRKVSQEISEERGGFHVFGLDEEDERRLADKQRKADELYDEAQGIRRCRAAVARHVAAIIGENIEIQFSKWNME
jgi:hypothetical protein